MAKQKLGEDYEKREGKAVDAAKKAFGKRFSGRKKVSGFFADLYENDFVHPDFYSVTTNDSVGSKLMLAQASIQFPELAEQISSMYDKQRFAKIAGVFNTVAQDGIAMNVNDLAPWGTAFFDQIMKFTACQSAFQEKLISGDVELGLVRALELSDVSAILGVPQLNLGKCETASLDETITTVDREHGFELVFTGSGFIRKTDVYKDGKIGGELKIHPDPGYVIIGFGSSGPHSNGYTALRLRLLDGSFEQRGRYAGEYTGRFKLDDKVPGDGRSFLEVLIEPTTIYSKLMAHICKEMPEAYGVNITGNGLHNFNRSGKNVGYVIENPMEPQAIFKVFEEEVARQVTDGKISEKNAYDSKKLHTKLNMGMGFACIAKAEHADRILKIAKRYDVDAKVVGEVKSSGSSVPTTILHLPEHKKPLVFVGYG